MRFCCLSCHGKYQWEKLSNYRYGVGIPLILHPVTESTMKIVSFYFQSALTTARLMRRRIFSSYNSDPLEYPTVVERQNSLTGVFDYLAYALWRKLWDCLLATPQHIFDVLQVLSHRATVREYKLFR